MRLVLPAFPWALGALSLPLALLLPHAWQWTAIPVMFALVALGYWSIWPRRI